MFASIYIMGIKFKEDFKMEILIPVHFTHVRFATEEEKVKEWYVVKDEKLALARMGYVKLNQNFTITLKEAQEIYNRIIKKFDLKEGEEIKNLKIDLTRYYEYNTDGTPKLADEEYPKSYDIDKEKTATYNPKLNKLMIWKNGSPVYENNNGVICTDEVALADTYL